MLLAAAILTASINVDINLAALIVRNPTTAAGVTCGIKTVGYRFVGKPGQEFRYAGQTWTIPIEGSIELLADRKRQTYAIAGRSISLEVGQHDQFGFREIGLPSNASASEGGSK